MKSLQYVLRKAAKCPEYRITFCVFRKHVMINRYLYTLEYEDTFNGTLIIIGLRVQWLNVRKTYVLIIL